MLNHKCGDQQNVTCCRQSSPMPTVWEKPTAVPNGRNQACDAAFCMHAVKHTLPGHGHRNTNPQATQSLPASLLLSDWVQSLPLSCSYASRTQSASLRFSLRCSEVVDLHDPDGQLWIIVHEDPIDSGSMLRQLGLEPLQGGSILLLDSHAPALSNFPHYSYGTWTVEAAQALV